MGSWDRGVDFSSFYNILRRNIASRRKNDVCYSAIALIQLRNGSRIAEAVDGFKQFILTREQVIHVRVRKKKKEDYRLMVIPDELLQYNIVEVCSDLVNLSDKKLRDRVRKYLYNLYGINTHSLRYAFITYLIKNNISVSIVSKITHHSNLNYILQYTQQRLADDVLKSL